MTVFICNNRCPTNYRKVWVRLSEIYQIHHHHEELVRMFGDSSSSEGNGRKTQVFGNLSSFVSPSFEGVERGGGGCRGTENGL